MIATAVTRSRGAEDAKRRPRRVRVGVVTGVGRQKTIRVECHYSTRHRKYGKLLKRRTRLQVHDPQNEAKLGDRVEIMECRPISKTKNWRLRKVLST